MEKWSQFKAAKAEEQKKRAGSQKAGVVSQLREKASALELEMSAAQEEVAAPTEYSEEDFFPAEAEEDPQGYVETQLAKIPTLEDLEAAAKMEVDAAVESPIESAGALLESLMGGMGSKIPRSGSAQQATHSVAVSH
eukprot:scaffold61357_cov35-Prasinocladus_malaysianus.AAC.1